MKCDQIAHYVHNDVQAEMAAHRLGLTSSEANHATATAGVGWVEDIVEGRVRFGFSGDWEYSKAHLRFNYAHGTEIELLTYLEGPHWHARNTAEFRSGQPFLSHIGFHLAPDESWPTYLAPELLVQEMVTDRHTNQFLIQRGRTYQYRIYDTRAWLGTYSKFIRRVEKGEVA